MKVRQKTSVQIKAQANCPSHSLAEVKIRDLELAIDEPEVRGGTNKGPSPTETAIAALAGCTNVIANKCAQKLGIDIGHLDIEVIADFDRRGVTLSEEIDVPFTRIVLNIVADGTASQNELEKVAAETTRFCPLSKLFTHSGTIIEENWSMKTT